MNYLKIKMDDRNNPSTGKKKKKTGTKAPYTIKTWMVVFGVKEPDWSGPDLTPLG